MNKRTVIQALARGAARVRVMNNERKTTLYLSLVALLYLGGFALIAHYGTHHPAPAVACGTQNARVK
jgi:hypothetical protein